MSYLIAFTSIVYCCVEYVVLQLTSIGTALWPSWKQSGY